MNAINLDVVFIKHFLNYFMPKKALFLIIDYSKAIDELKSGIYSDSLKFGPEHLETNQSYF